jgi:integrase
VGFTGLRKNERAGLRWLDLLLDGDDPAVSLRAEITKNRQDSRIPLVPWLARALRERWKERGEWQGRPVRHSDSVFHVPDRIARLVRGDAAWAELGEKEPTWHRLDFHALRGSSDLLTWPGIQRPAGG